jgi:hypothetical protein
MFIIIWVKNHICHRSGEWQKWGGADPAAEAKLDRLVKV